MPHQGISAAQSPAAFASMHLGGLDLGDRRLTRRAERVAAAIASCPHASLPRQCGDPHQAKGASRLFDHDAVTGHAISRQHRDRTLEEARGRDVVLFIQDTTELIFAESRAGVGPIGYDESAHGLLMHSTLAITPDGLVLGLGDLKIWARGPARRGESQATRRGREGRESLRWKEAIEAVGAPPAGTTWIHVGDRQADVWETIVAALEVGSDCVIRACGAAAKRKASIGHGEGAPKRADATPLDTLARTLPQAGACEVEHQARPGVPRRTMRLRV